MKRLLVFGVLIAIVVGAVGAHGKSKTVTSVGPSEPVPAAPVAASTVKSHPAPHVKYTRCDQNISVAPATTCGFADNVFRAFARQVSSEGAGNHTVRAVSAATGKTYAMSCDTSAGTTLCTGGHAAKVRFPLSAAESYYRPATPSPESTPSYGGEAEAEAGEAEPEEGGGGDEEESQCTSGSYTNSSGNTVCKPEESSSGPPAGATAECGDGTYSFSEHRSGTCSYHGGVATWLE